MQGFDLIREEIASAFDECTVPYDDMKYSVEFGMIHKTVGELKSHKMIHLRQLRNKLQAKVPKWFNAKSFVKAIEKLAEKVFIQN